MPQTDYWSTSDWTLPSSSPASTDPDSSGESADDVVVAVETPDDTADVKPAPARRPATTRIPQQTSLPSVSSSSDGSSVPSTSSSSSSSSSSDPGPSRSDAFWRWTRMRLRALWTLRTLGVVVIAGIFLGSLYIIAGDLQSFQYSRVASYLTSLPVLYVAVAIFITMVNFLVLAGYDALAFRYVDARLAPRRILFSAFVGYAVSQAVGNPILTGGSVRFRLYSSWGLKPETITKSILFAGTSFWLGFCTLGSAVFLLQPVSMPDGLHLPITPTVAGVACLVPMVGYLGLTSLRDAPVRVQGWTLPVPPRWMLPAQVGLAACDLILATSVLYVLLPPSASIAFQTLLSVYLIALLAGLISHVPGGLGVFDGVVVLMLSPLLPTETILGALLAYRGIFHLLPLTIALLGFGLYEARRGLSR